jgi:WD40 repeat protein
VRGLAFSPDGTQLATAQGDLDAGEWERLPGDVRLWEVDTGQPRAALKAHRFGSFAVAFSPDGQTLATGGGEDRCARLWRRQQDGWRPHATLPTGNWVESLSFAADGRTLATPGHDSLVLWDVSTGKRRASRTMHAGATTCVGFAPAGKVLASGGREGTVRLWDEATGQGRVVAHLGAINAVTFSRDGKTLASACIEEVKVWEVKPDEEAQKLPRANVLKLSRDGRTMVSLDTHVRVFAAGAEKAALPFLVGSGWIALTEDGRRVAYPDGANTIAVADWATGGPPARLRVEEETVQATAAFSPDGRLLATAGMAGKVRVWDVDRGQLLITLPDEKWGVYALTFSPDGRTLAVGQQSGRTRLWDTRSWKIKLSVPGPHGIIWALAFSPDGRRLAVGSVEGLIQVWDLASASPHAALRGHTAAIRALAFFPDATTLASSSADRTVKLWDVLSGQARMTLRDFPGKPWSVAVSPDGTSLWAAGPTKLTVVGGPEPDRGVARRWLAPRPPEARAVQSELSRRAANTPAAQLNRAKELRAAGRLSEAAEAFRLAAGRLERLKTAFPATAGYRLLRADAEQRLGEVLLVQGLASQARATYRRAEDLLTRLVADFPTDQECRARLAAIRDSAEFKAIAK